MGSADSAGSVVDPVSMRVHGLDGLRVVDASTMLYITNGNIYAPVMMMAEKAALIADLHAGQFERERGEDFVIAGRDCR